MMNKQTPIEIDETSRTLILNNIEENYFVEAGAGSGKTTTLVGRMVKMIEEGKKIEHLSAITFTKAAANEFYERFHSRLIEKSLENNEHKEKYLEAIQNIDLAFMGTIDSFCNMLMAEHPSEGLIPANARVIDDNKARELYAREYANIQNGKYNDVSLEEKAKLFIKYDDFAKDNFVSVLQAVLNHRDCVLEVPALAIENIDHKFADELKTLRKIVKVLVDHPEYITASNDNYAKELRNNLKNNKYIFDDDFDSNASKIERAFKKTFFKGLNKDKKTSDFRLYFADEVREKLAEGIDYFISHKDKWYDINYDKLCFATKYIEKVKYFTALDFVNSAKDRILAVLRKEGYLTFNDYLIYLRDTLRKDAEDEGKLIKHIYERHRYFLIDEFQDTDPIQAEIFFYLAAKEIKTNWQDCIPHKGSLFIVGDPKQSIYRFKNADVASYLKVEEMFNRPEIGQVLHLYQNFRSTVELRKWFNDCFKELLPTTTINQAPFEDIPVALDDGFKGGFAGVYKYNVPSRASGIERDEKKVTDILLKIHHNEKYKIVEKIKDKDNNLSYISRTIDWQDIMLITPSKPVLARYTKEFREKGIPYFVEGNINFNESKAFVALVDYFGAVTNPNDNRYLYKVLKSAVYKIKEAEIIEATNNGYIFNVLADVNSLMLSASLKHALNELKKFALLAKQISSSSLFVRLMEEIKVFKIFGNENMEYVYFALELLKSKEDNKEIVTHNDALNFFNGLFLTENEQERCPSLQASTNQVHLANLHKVKGLEAPIVLLASPKGKDREPSFRMARDGDCNRGYLFNVSKRFENGSYKIINTDLYDEPYKKDELESGDAESLRLEYVAATRAKNVLIIANQVTKNGPSESIPWIDLLKANASQELNDIELLLTNEKKEDCDLSPIDYDDFAKTENVLLVNANNLKRPAYELKNPSKVIADNGPIDNDISERMQKQFAENSGDTLATLSGTLVHRLLELIIMSKDQIAKQEAINFAINENITSEFETKIPYFVALLSKVYDVMHNGGFVQKGEAKQDILPIILSADKCYCEVPFTIKDGDYLWNGIIDLIYEKTGKLHIIDWKTNKKDEHLDEHYQEQLVAYKKAVKQAMGLEVEDAVIYHLDITIND